MRNKLLVLATVCALVFSSVTVSASVNSPSPDKHVKVTIGDFTYDGTNGNGNDTITVGEAGSVNVSFTEETDEDGNTVFKYVFEASPKDGYEFQYWLVNGEIVYGSTLSIVPDDDTTIQAVFKNTATGEIVSTDKNLNGGGSSNDNGSTSPKTGYPVGAMSLLFLASGAVLVYSRKKITE